MDVTNEVRLTGTLAGAVAFSHENRGEEFYTFPLCVARLSGATDTINITARKSVLDACEISGGGKLTVLGSLRSFNNKSGVGAKLIISVFAQSIENTELEDENSVMLSGTLCKTPVFRKTPMGRRICDMMLAVSRRYGRSDYLPCIAWGIEAESAATLDVGDAVTLYGRIQSRTYIKNTDGVPTERTAYEVSVLELIDEWEIHQTEE